MVGLSPKHILWSSCRPTMETKECMEPKRLGLGVERIKRFAALGRVHLLKVDDRLLMYYIVKGEKTFEIRLNDRDFRTGDILVLAFWDGHNFHECSIKRVTFVMHGGLYGLQKQFVAMSVEPYQSNELCNDEIYDLAFIRDYGNTDNQPK